MSERTSERENEHTGEQLRNEDEQMTGSPAQINRQYKTQMFLLYVLIFFFVLSVQFV